MTDLPRIYFDTNALAECGAYWLHTAGSLEDIQRLGHSLLPGMRVLLYMTDELEVEATLEYDGQHRHWLGRADMSTLRYLP